MITLKLTKDCIRDCSHQGQCYPDIQYWLKQPRIANQMSRISPEDAKNCLKGYGAWNDEELNNHEDNLERVLWIACNDAKEQIFNKEQQPCLVEMD